MRRYLEKQRRQRNVSYAARYEPDTSNDGVLAVARKMDSDAAMAEVPELRVLVVRYFRVPDDQLGQTYYLVVEAGHLLVYSKTFDLLYSSDPDEFADEYEEA